MTGAMRSTVLGLAVVLCACGGGKADEPGGGPGGGGNVTLPTWQLEDVQPQSPRFGTTYGLSVYTGHPLVVVLLEGF